MQLTPLRVPEIESFLKVRCTAAGNEQTDVGEQYNGAILAGRAMGYICSALPVAALSAAYSALWGHCGEHKKKCPAIFRQGRSIGLRLILSLLQSTATDIVNGLLL